jgi:hypothetical protein
MTHCHDPVIGSSGALLDLAPSAGDFAVGSPQTTAGEWRAISLVDNSLIRNRLNRLTGGERCGDREALRIRRPDAMELSAGTRESIKVRICVLRRLTS